MLLSTLVPFFLAALPSLAQDIRYDSAHNATPITGTWSTGSRAVSTGPVRRSTLDQRSADRTYVPQGFANPANQSFIYPKNTGVSYSL